MKRNLWGFPLFILLFIVIVVVVTIKDEKKETNNNSTKAATEEVNANQPDYTKGKIVFDNLKSKVCEERDLCWISQGYAISGDRVLKKEFPTTWGNKTVLLIPKDEWIAISDKDKEDLVVYLNFIGVNNIITGRVKPAEYSDGSINTSRNLITVDETVWSSNN